MYLNYQSLELPAALCGLLNVYLAARANVWNWLFGILTVSLYLVIFYQVKLYADMSLQSVFLMLQFYGFYQWQYGGEQHCALAIDSMPKASWKWLLLGGLLIAAVISWILKTYTDSTQIPLDVFTATLSLAAQWMMSKKYIQNWLMWIVVDMVSIYMYVIKHLYLTAGLYLVFLVICISGYISWLTRVSTTSSVTT